MNDDSINTDHVTLTSGDLYHLRKRLGIDDSKPCAECGVASEYDPDGKDIVMTFDRRFLNAETTSDETYIYGVPVDYFISCNQCGYKKNFRIEPILTLIREKEDERK